MSKKAKTISIVVPVYNEAKNVPLLYEEVKKHTADLDYKFEMIFVDDGSADNSAAVIKELQAKDKNVRFVELARNFGKEAATSAGLHRANGDAALMIDADMQMPPSLIGKFVKQWEEGSDIVIGVFSHRSMSFIRRTGARIFYRIMGKIAHTKIKPHATDYRLLDRKVVDVFKKLTEQNRITRGLIDWMGFKRNYIYFNQLPREHGAPTYSMKKLVDLAVNSFITYSLFPLKFAGFLGIVILIVSIPGGLFLFVERYVLNDPFNWGINGTTMLAALTLFLVGVILACLGLISLYIGHIHAEVKNRPLYVVRNDYRGKSDDDEEEMFELEGEPV